MATIKHFVQSEPFVPSKPGEPVTWLKAKYRDHKPMSRGHSGQSGNANPKRNKTRGLQTKIVKKALVINLATGTRRFEVIDVIYPKVEEPKKVKKT